MKLKDAHTFMEVSAFASRCFSWNSLANIFARLRTAFLVGVGGCVILAGGTPLAAQDSGAVDIDRSVRPGADFYRYANGGWLGRVTVPTDNRSVMAART